jgi:hypothetical protein
MQRIRSFLSSAGTSSRGLSFELGVELGFEEQRDSSERGPGQHHFHSRVHPEAG